MATVKQIFKDLPSLLKATYKEWIGCLWRKDDLEPLVVGIPYLTPYADTISLVIIVGALCTFP